VGWGIETSRLLVIFRKWLLSYTYLSQINETHTHIHVYT
jgi:hypothetical protein